VTDKLTKPLFVRHEKNEWTRERQHNPPEVTAEELEEAAAQIKKQKSSGPRQHTARNCKTNVQAFPRHGKARAEENLRSATFPRRWKVARLVLLQKPNKTPTGTVHIDQYAC
jgi:hypothetical protein